MKFTRLQPILWLSLTAPRAHAQLAVSEWFAGGLTYSQAINNLIGTFAATIAAVSAAAFLLGALFMIIGSAYPDYQGKGKNLMIGALVGMGIVLSAKAIFNTALYFLYG